MLNLLSIYKKNKYIYIVIFLVVIVTAVGVSAFYLRSSYNQNESSKQEVISDDILGQAYTLFSPIGSNLTYLIDVDGNYVHKWQSDYEPGPTSYLLDNGKLLRSIKIPNDTFNVGGSGGGLELLDWDGNQIWKIDLITQLSSQHHDIDVMPNGNILATIWDIKSKEEAVNAGFDSKNVPENGIWSERVIEINTQTSDIDWQWDSWDHLVQDISPDKQNFGNVTDYGKINTNFYTFPDGSSDWLHINSIDYNSASDQIILTAHSFSEVWIINHGSSTEQSATSDGDIIYRWGNPIVYESGTVNDQKLFMPHDGHWISDSASNSNVLIFNNGTKETGSSVVEITPSLSKNNQYSKENGQAFGPSEPVWSFSAGADAFYSPILSSAQRLPNGNTLILNGRAGSMFEIDKNKKIIWTYKIPGAGGLSVLTFNVERHFEKGRALRGRTLTSMGPVPPITGTKTELPEGNSNISTDN